MKNIIFIVFVFQVLVGFSNGNPLGVEDSTQTKVDSVKTPEGVEQYKVMLDVIDRAVYESFEEYYGKKKVDSILKVYKYDYKNAPEFPDSVYKQRIQNIDALTPFQLAWNDEVISVVKYFAKKRRKFTALALGRSKLYFPLFEEYLDKYDLPLELKYLAIIESGLRPTIKSRVGACGLWQFMYRTGKFYGLEENSYIDERMNPIKATDAACRYLKKLHDLYKDWSLALAAYNAGPGNVNKAIRRSGGKTTYWEIRPYLPRETQGYVPGFIAMTYMMTHHEDHNVQPIEVKMYNFEVDTVCLRAAIRFKTLDTLLNVNMDNLIHLNPQYKKHFVPFTPEETRCLVLPKKDMNKFIEMEDSIYKFDSLVIKQYIETNPEKVTAGGTSSSNKGATVHYVRSGENLGVIAQRYGVSVRNLMDWNNLRSTRINIGQKLYVRGAKKKSSSSKSSSSSSKSSNSSSKSTSNYKPKSGTPSFHTLRSGESLWTVSQKYGIPFDVLQKLNPGLNPKKMQPGDKIKLK